MSAFESPRSAPFGAISTFRAVSFFERLVDGLAAWKSKRATEAALLALSDKQLADIGLYRGQIAEIAHRLAQR